MPYLVDSDYTAQIRTEQLTQLIESTPANRTDAEAKAISQAKSRLRNRYDVDALFAKTGAERDPELVMYIVDMTLYHLHARQAPGQVPEMRDKRYADALAWLEKVAAGDFDPGFPPKGDDDGDGVDDGNVLQWGSATPRNPYF